jgi:hypothetical protein
MMIWKFIRPAVILSVLALASAAEAQDYPSRGGGVGGGGGGGGGGGVGGG